MDEWFTALLAGLICGFIDSSLGMGYGVTSATLLVAFGIAPAIASASTHTSEMIVDCVSALSHYRLRNVEFRLLKPLLLSGVLGAVLGALFLVYVAGFGFAKPYVRIVLLIMGATILYKHTLEWRKQKTSKLRWKNKHLSLLGFFAGFIDVSGGGWTHNDSNIHHDRFTSEKDRGHSRVHRATNLTSGSLNIRIPNRV